MKEETRKALMTAESFAKEGRYAMAVYCLRDLEDTKLADMDGFAWDLHKSGAVSKVDYESLVIGIEQHIQHDRLNPTSTKHPPTGRECGDGERAE